MKKFLFSTVILIAFFSSLAFAGDAKPKLLLDGATLYQQNCAGCHAPLERTLIPDRSTSRIASAINTMGVMGKQRQLNPRQIEAISQILKSADK